MPCEYPVSFPVSYLNGSLSILRITFIACGISLSLLVSSSLQKCLPLSPALVQVTGVFGVKAYRCLDSSRLVSAALVALRTAGTVVLTLDMVDIHSRRTLSGTCSRSPLVRHLTREQGIVIGHHLVFLLHLSYSCLPSSCSFPHAVGHILRFLWTLLTYPDSPLCSAEITRACGGPGPHLCSTFARRCH